MKNQGQRDKIKTEKRDVSSHGCMVCSAGRSLRITGGHFDRLPSQVEIFSSYIFPLRGYT